MFSPRKLCIPNLESRIYCTLTLPRLESFHTLNQTYVLLSTRLTIYAALKVLDSNRKKIFWFGTSIDRDASNIKNKHKMTFIEQYFLFTWHIYNLTKNWTSISPPLVLYYKRAIICGFWAKNVESLLLQNVIRDGLRDLVRSEK